MTMDRRKLYQQIADDLERLVVEGAFPADSRLPSEQELAERYEVSRNVVREALKSLAEVGLVSIKTGSGTFVRRPTTKPVVDALDRVLRQNTDGLSPTHFREIRLMLEPDSAGLAATRAGEDDLRALHAAYQAMVAQSEDPETWRRAELQFHLAVASATHNPLLRNILDPLIELLCRMGAPGSVHPSEVLQSLEMHRQILEAIQSRNPDEAYRAMLADLDGRGDSDVPAAGRMAFIT